MLDGRGRLPLLDELVGHLVAERGVVGPELGDLHELGPGLVALAGGLVVVGQRLVELDRVGRGLELLLGPLDQRLEPARAGQHLDGRRPGLLGVVGIVDVGVEVALGGRGAEDLLGDLHGDVGLVLALVLEHEPDEGGGLVAGAAAGAAEHGLGQLVQAELVHLARQADLGVGVEAEAEEPLGRLAGAVEVAGEDRQAEGLLLAPLGGGVVERLDRVDHGQGLVRVAPLLQQLGQDEPQCPTRAWTARRPW